MPAARVAGWKGESFFFSCLREAQTLIFLLQKEEKKKLKIKLKKSKNKRKQKDFAKKNVLILFSTSELTR